MDGKVLTVDSHLDGGRARVDKAEVGGRDVTGEKQERFYQSINRSNQLIRSKSTNIMRLSNKKRCKQPMGFLP